MSSELQAALKAVEGAVYAENERGGEARAVVAEVGRLVGISLGAQVIGEVWAVANMQRVIKAVRDMRDSRDALIRENFALRKECQQLHRELDTIAEESSR
ncbi:hypothetical protein [Micromonospora sp. NPDC049240]|uniref:hypothetical protein n=1 Tax=Micromonospora sp. NPDC049240 TaxID=3155151 RepID=UPI0033F0600D